MKTLIIGDKGVMGRRYKAILNWMGEDYDTLDLNDEPLALQKKLFHCDKVIIATPTDQHIYTILDIVNARSQYHVDILCEKPVVRTGAHFLRLANLGWDNATLYCVNQYNYLPGVSKKRGATFYDYWNTGKDGLHWDCFQLFALGYATPHLDNKSPVWKCSINGDPMNIQDMDSAYFSMIVDFLSEKRRMWGLRTILETTEKIFKYEADTLSAYRHPSKVELD
jgi:hypothetical protein